MSGRVSKLFFELAALGLLSHGLVVAQTSTTAIHGIVRDPSGAVIPNAALKLKDSSTGLESVSTSTEDGAFAFPSIRSGAYDLTASAPGFQTSVIKSIVVDTGRVTDVTSGMPAKRFAAQESNLKNPAVN